MAVAKHLKTFVFVASAVALVLAAAGCDTSETTNPCGDLPPLFPFKYNSELSVVAPSDSVVLMLGGESKYHSFASETEVFVSTRSSPDDSLRLSMDLIGMSHIRQSDAAEPGAIAHQWVGDTLQVWFSLGLPPPWAIGASVSKCSPVPPWIIPQRIDVVLPEGVYFERIYEPVEWDW